ncbi:hypothetical protein [Agrobacterium tumefaciens]|uniref:hypothetical protein n=1 Tax=Agrobacterium tumefaciens TaxID=358 RepID=UPI00045ABE6F|nr:hypothetical protein [Agrobacterium tumefaciens]CDN96499.1 hypothetical protein BN949_05678 [Agrobacterium tumefaciens]
MSKNLEELLAMVIRQPGKIEAMSEEDRRAYNAEAARASRLRKRETRTTGQGKPTTDITRDLLADIAIMMLASDAPGSDTIMSGLRTYFGDRVGFPTKIKADCRKGKLKPRLIATAQDAPAQTG